MVKPHTSVVARWIGAVVLVLCSVASRSARAADGVVVVTGTPDAKQRTAATAAATSALRAANWSLVDASFNGKDVEKIQECFQSEHPWPCLDPIAGPKAIAKVVLLELLIDKQAGGVNMVAQLAGTGQAGSGIQKAYCPAPCSESALAQSASDLIKLLLDDLTARTGKTFIEVITQPPGASVAIDGRQLGPSGQKFPAHAGRHRVVMQLSGYRDADAEVDVVDGETKRFETSLKRLEGQDSSPEKHHHPPRVVQWSMIGGGAAVFVGGSLYSYYTALDTAPPPGQPRDSKWLYNGKALTVAGIGGAVAVGGLVWLLLTPISESKPTISLSHGGVQAAWSITF